MNALSCSTDGGVFLYGSLDDPTGSRYVCYLTRRVTRANVLMVDDGRHVLFGAGMNYKYDSMASVSDGSHWWAWRMAGRCA